VSWASFYLEPVDGSDVGLGVAVARKVGRQ
jgi:hypothetical protein